MRVLVAGATGDVGLPVVRRLLERGHDVVAMSRSASRAAPLRDLGVRHVAASALDRDAVRRAVGDADPQGIVDLLTALPRNGPLRASHLEPTNELRRVGSANLVDAAREAGIGRLVAESIAFVYGYSGPTPATESDPPAPEGTISASYGPSIAAAIEKERRVVEAGGIALRFGLFYGPDVGSTRFTIRMLRRRMLGLPGGGRGVLPLIHVDDAATAVATALDSEERGVFNVADDEAATWRAFTQELSRRMELPRPYGIPAWLARPFAPYPAMFLGRALLRVSSEKAKRAFGWAPAFPTYREGAADVALRYRP